MALPINTLASIIVLAGLSAVQAGDVCREAAAADPTFNYGLKRCIDSEHAARDELARKWKDFPAKDQRECTTVATLGGSASYVQLITCLELSRDVRQARSCGRI
jgi:hypothetical protein